MAAPQEAAISPDTEATGHLHTITVPQEETAHSAIQAVALQVLHAPTQAQAAQAPTQAQAAQAQAQDHQVAVAAVAHAAVAA